MAIRKNDLVLLDVNTTKSLLNTKRGSTALEVKDKDVILKLLSKGAKSVGTVISSRTKEQIIEADGHSKVYVSTTADVVWPEGFVRNCPVEFLIKVTNEQ